MIKELNAVLVEGQEADDKMASSQTRDTVICSIDKDLWMVPGKHYDIATGKKVLSKDPGGLVLKGKKLLGTGFAWFCAQMLMGDTIDNIKGIKGIGPAKAYKLLINKKGSVKLLWRRVRAIYKMHDQLHRLEESAVLLWMRREPEQHPYTWIKENT
jgi:5'-3' exonuclease